MIRLVKDTRFRERDNGSFSGGQRYKVVVQKTSWPMIYTKTGRSDKITRGDLVRTFCKTKTFNDEDKTSPT